MKPALITFICIMLVFTALGIACAVIVGLRRKPQADPYDQPFGDMPVVSGINADVPEHTTSRIWSDCPPARERRPFLIPLDGGRRSQSSHRGRSCRGTVK